MYFGFKIEREVVRRHIS